MRYKALCSRSKDGRIRLEKNEKNEK